MALTPAEIDQIVSQLVTTLAATAKISELPPGPLLAGAEEFEANAAGTSVKYTAVEIATFVGSAGTLQTAYDAGSTIDISLAATPFEITGTLPAANELIKIIDDLGREVLVEDRNNPILKSNYDIELKDTGIAPLPVWGTHGAVTMFKWNSTLKAIRGGEVTATQWDEVNIGSHTYSFGLNVNASGSASGALGEDVDVAGDNSLGIGDGSSALSVPTANFLSLLFSNGMDLQTSASGPIRTGDITGGNFTNTTSTAIELNGTIARRKEIQTGFMDDQGGGAAGITRPFPGLSAFTFDDAFPDRLNAMSNTIPFDFDATDDIQVDICWAPINTSIGNVKWDISYQSNPCDDTVAVDPTPPLATATVATTGVAGRIQTTTITIGTVALSTAVGHRLIFGLVRDTTVGGNYGFLVRVHAITPTYLSIKA